MVAEPLSLVKLAERDDLAQQMADLEAETYPPYFAIQSNYYDAMTALGDRVSDLKLAIVDAENTLLAGAEAVPIYWSGQDKDLPEGYDAALAKALADKGNPDVNTICLVNLMVSTAARGRNLSVKMMQSFWADGVIPQPKAVIANIRCVLKSDHPRTPIKEYVSWTTQSGEPFDPWLRAFKRAGARIGPSTDQALTITAPVEEWEALTGLKIAEDGDIEIPQGLAPLKVDIKKRVGRYEEPGVWVIMNEKPQTPMTL